MRLSFIHFIYLVLIVVASFSCKKLAKYKDIDKITNSNWNPIVALPLVNASFNVYDILANTDSTDLVVIDDNSGEIALIYKGEVASLLADEIIKLPTLKFTNDFSLIDIGLVAIPSFANKIDKDIIKIIDFDPGNGVEFHKINFKQGTLEIEVSTTLKHNIKLQLLFPELIRNGKPVTEELHFNYNGTIPQLKKVSIDLSGVEGDFTLNQTSVNELETKYTISVTGTGEPINGSERISIKTEYLNLKYNNAIGYFGQQFLGGNKDSILLRIFTAVTDGYFELTNPSLRLEMVNSFGFPVEVNLSDLKTVNTVNKQAYYLEGYPNSILIKSAQKFGQSETSSLELNTNNTSNLSSVITPVPKYFHFAATGLSNPKGRSNVLNFIEDTSKFIINAELELPLEGFAYDFVLKDTIDFSLDEDLDNIDSILLRLSIDNGFPVQLLGSIQFLDAQYNPILKITDGMQEVLEPGRIDNSGTVIDATKTITDFIVGSKQVALLNSAKYILLTAEAQSNDGKNETVIKLFDYYIISLKLGMKVKMNFDF